MEEDEDTYIVPPFEEEALYAQMENNQIEYLDRTSLKYVKTSSLFINGYNK